MLLYFEMVSPVLPQTISLDWLQTPTGIMDDEGQIASAVFLALNTDATASASDVLPDPRDSDRRGWWGDLDAEKVWNGWPIGSKLWLLTRAKIVDSKAREGATITRVDAYIRAALQPFVDARIFSKFDVEVTLMSSQRISSKITIYRGPKSAIDLQFQSLWTEIYPQADYVTQ